MKKVFEYNKPEFIVQFDNGALTLPVEQIIVRDKST